MTSCLLESAVYWQYRFSFPTDVKCLLPEISRPWMNPNEQQSFNMRVKRLFCWNKSIKQAEISVLYILNGASSQLTTKCFSVPFPAESKLYSKYFCGGEKRQDCSCQATTAAFGAFPSTSAGWAWLSLTRHIDPALPLQQIYPRHRVSLMTRWSSVAEWLETLSFSTVINTFHFL